MKSILSAVSFIFILIHANESVGASKAVVCDVFGMLYDIDVATGFATNPRPTGLDYLTGLTFGADGRLFGLTTFATNPANSLVSIDPTTGMTQLVGATGLDSIFEGDLAFDRATGLLYGLVDAPNAPAPPRSLFTINPLNGVATIVGDVGGGDPSAIAFSESGTLHIIDADTDRLLIMDKTNAALITSVSLSITVGPGVGMDFDPATGVLYVVEGGSHPVVNLYTLNPTTGVMAIVGPTGLSHGLSGLTFKIPEPSTKLLFVYSAILLFSSRLRSPHCEIVTRRASSLRVQVRLLRGPSYIGRFIIDDIRR
jgi:hypothetical protein